MTMSCFFLHVNTINNNQYQPGILNDEVLQEYKGNDRRSRKKN